MKLGLIAVCTLSFIAAVGAVGCSSSSDESEDSGGPVAASPLTGQVNGTSFAGKSAIARKSSGEKKSIDIYDTDIACDAVAPKADRSILISVPWTAATSRDFKLSLSGGGENQTATFVVQKDGQTSNIISTQGRVEVIEAPAEKGALGKIRLRATAQGNSVEGEIAVKVCD